MKIPKTGTVKRKRNNMIKNKIEEYLTKQGKTVNDAIADSFAQLAKFNSIRQFMTDEEKQSILRLSACGKCPRAQAYVLHGFPVNGKEMDARSKFVFWMGDMVENMIVHLAMLSGCNIQNAGLDQKRVSIDVDGLEVFGSPDGDLMPDNINFEVKSMSSFAFRRAEAGEIDHSYLCQSHAYMKAKNQDKTILVYVNKDSGVLGEIVINWNEAVWQDALRRLKLARHSTKDSLPDAEFRPDAKGFYPWNCTYCANWKDCHPKAQKVVVKGSYKLKA